MNIGQFLQDIGNPIAYFPNLARAIGGVKETVFLCQLLYWQGKQKDKEGWIYKTQKEIHEETGLSRYEQETARKNLKRIGILEEKYQGIPRQLFFKINFEKLQVVWLEWLQKQKERTQKPLSDGQQTIMRESNIQQSGNPTNKEGGLLQTIPYNTTENTSKNTNKLTSGHQTNQQENKQQNEILMTVPVKNGRPYPVTSKQIEQWQKTFDLIDVKARIYSLIAWFEANPDKQWTSSKQVHFALPSKLAKYQEEERKRILAQGGDPDDPTGDKAAEEAYRATKELLRQMPVESLVKNLAEEKSLTKQKE